jgi:hypothetical protein
VELLDVEAALTVLVPDLPRALERLQAVEALGGTRRVRVLALRCRAVLAWEASPEESERRFREALALARTPEEDGAALSAVLIPLGMRWTEAGRHGEAEEALLDAQRWARTTGDLHLQCSAAGHLCMLHADRGEGALALAFAEESLRLTRGLGHRLALATSSRIAGLAAALAGDLGRSTQWLEESVSLLDEDSWKASALTRLALVQLARGRSDAARTALLAAEPLLRGSPAPLWRAAHALLHGHVPELAPLDTNLLQRVWARFIRAQWPEPPSTAARAIPGCAAAKA